MPIGWGVFADFFLSGWTSPERGPIVLIRAAFGREAVPPPASDSPIITPVPDGNPPTDPPPFGTPAPPDGTVGSPLPFGAPIRGIFAVGIDAWLTEDARLWGSRLDYAVFSAPDTDSLDEAARRQFESADITAMSFTLYHWGFADGEVGPTLAQATADGFVAAFSGSPSTVSGMTALDAGKDGFGQWWAALAYAQVQSLTTTVSDNGYEGILALDVNCWDSRITREGLPDGYSSRLEYKNAVTTQLATARIYLSAFGYRLLADITGITSTDADSLYADDLIGIADYSCVRDFGATAAGSAQSSSVWDRLIRAGATAAARGRVLVCRNTTAVPALYNDYLARIICEDDHGAVAWDDDASPFDWDPAFELDWGAQTSIMHRSGSELRREFEGGTLHVDLAALTAWSSATTPTPGSTSIVGSFYLGARIDGDFYQTCYGSPNNADVPYSGSELNGAALQLFSSHAGKKPSFVQWGASGSAWPPLPFDTAAALRAWNAGMFSQYDWATARPGLDAILANTAAAKSYLGTLAGALTSFGHPIVFRPIWEMNGTWFAWGAANYTAAQYITLWRTIWHIFADVAGGFAPGSGLGTDTGNVTFFWCPNRWSPGGTIDPTSRYPGSAYVDMIGWDGYIGNNHGSTYQTPEQVHGLTYTTVAALDPELPIGIGEWGVGATLSSPGKAAFITAMLDPTTGWLASKPRIKYASYFNDNSFEAAPDKSLPIEQDSTACPVGVSAPQAAFSAAARQSRYCANVASAVTMPSGAKVPFPATPVRSEQSVTNYDVQLLTAHARPASNWRPFSDSAPFNQLASGSLYDDGTRTSASIVNYLKTNRANAMQTHALNAGATADDWQHPMYFAKSSDALVTVHNREDTANGGSYGSAETEGQQFRVPLAALPAGTFSGNVPDNDGHFTVVQPDGRVLTCWQAEKGFTNGGTLWCTWSALDSIGGDGLTRSDKPGSTAARFVAGCGSIRWEELANGSIGHALFGVTYRTRGHVAPATGDASETPDTHAPPLGALLRYTKDEAYISAQAWPAWLKTIARAMRDYGIILGDTGGDATTAINIMVESDVVYRSFTDFSSPYPNERWAAAQGITSFSSGGRTVYTLRFGDYASTFKIEDFEVLSS